MSMRRSIVTIAVALVVTGTLAVIHVDAAQAASPRCTAGAVTVVTGSSTPSEPVSLAQCLADISTGGTVRLSGDYFTWGADTSTFAKLLEVHGSANNKVVVTGADSSHRSVVWGGVGFYGSSWLEVSGLYLRGTVPGQPTIAFAGGDHIDVHGNDITGARTTDAYANVSVAGDANYPLGVFRLGENCIHDAANSTDPVRAANETDHNIYVQYSATKPGLVAGDISITRNLIWGAPNGAGLKIGVGGEATSVGPKNLTVSYNTIGEDSRAVVLTGTVKDNLLITNLLFSSANPADGSTSKTTAIYLHSLPTAATGNRIAHTYVWNADTVAYANSQTAATVSTGTDNAVRANPQFLAGTTRACDNGWQPTNTEAKNYGRYAGL